MADSRTETRDALLELAINVHSELSEKIAPATPDTIRSSSLRNNVPLLCIAATGVLGFLALLYAAAGVGPADSQGSVPNKRFFDLVALIGGAALGSAFYSLWTARDYLQAGTFSRAYTQVYVIRFGLGIVSGFILGSVAPELALLKGEAKNLTPLTFAIVGGFSAEAVVQILQRISDILVSAVRGSDKEQAKAQAERATSKKLNETATKLQDALQGDDPAALKANIQNVIKGMLK